MDLLWCGIAFGLFWCVCCGGSRQFDAVNGSIGFLATPNTAAKSKLPDLYYGVGRGERQPRLVYVCAECHQIDDFYHSRGFYRGKDLATIISLESCSDKA
jgi:hypothetical protein